MLYVSTRDRVNTYTSHVALTMDRAPDGGLFVPFRIPVFSHEEISSLKDRSFNQIMADLLNLFFSARLTSWDMDFCIGKNTCRSAIMSHKLLICELWHNPDTSFVRAIERIGSRISANDNLPTPWLNTAVRICALFAAYGQLLNDGAVTEGTTFDLAVPADDMCGPIAAFLAKGMGLPIGTIICACCKEGNIWDLIQKGTLNPSGIPEELQAGLEALLYLVAGQDESCRFRSCCAEKKLYTSGENNPFSGLFYCTVAGKNRYATTLNSLFRSNQYVIDPVGALCASGLQDYRAGTGAGRIAWILSEESPLGFAKEIAVATGIPEEKLTQYVKL